MGGFLSGRTSLTTVQTADIANDAITLAKLAGGTDGNIISFDASGDPVAIVTGSDGQVLHSAGAGAQPAFETISAGWEFVESITASTSSTIDLGEGNLAAGYTYHIHCMQVDNSVDLTEANAPILQFGTSTGPTYQTSGYVNQFGWWGATSEDSGRDPMTTGIPLVLGSAAHSTNLGGATAGETWDAEVTIPNPAAAIEHRCLARGAGHNLSNQEAILTFSMGHRTTSETITGLRILPGTGTFISGIFVLSRSKIA